MAFGVPDFVPHPCNVINDVSHTISNVDVEHVVSVMKNLWTDEKNRQNVNLSLLNCALKSTLNSMFLVFHYISRESRC